VNQVGNLFELKSTEMKTHICTKSTFLQHVKRNFVVLIVTDYNGFCQETNVYLCNAMLC